MSGILPWSYSRLSIYEKCPRQFAFRYVDKVKMPARESSPQMERGTAMHNSVEAYLLGNTKDLHPEVEQHRGVFQNLRDKKATPELKVGLARDWSVLDFDHPDAWVRGVLDTRFHVEQVPTSYEWKSGKAYPDHEDQRFLYLLFLMALYPEREEFRVKTFYFDLNRSDALVIGPEDHLQVTLKREEFNDRAGLLETDTDYAARPGYYCSWCPFSRYKEGPCSIG